MTEPRGRIIINTGNGKGKTTAALGTMFRALGHGQKVCMIQFIKGKGDYGERLLAKRLDHLEWHNCGKGFLFKKEHLFEDKMVAQQGMELAREKIDSDEFDLVILDEITYLMQYGFTSVDHVIEMIRQRPSRLSIILTGRYAHRDLIAIADTVTFMTVGKHGFEAGIRAQKGIEF